MAELCLILADLLKFEITSRETVAHLGAIASPQTVSILKTFSHQNRKITKSTKYNINQDKNIFLFFRFSSSSSRRSLYNTYKKVPVHIQKVLWRSGPVDTLFTLSIIITIITTIVCKGITETFRPLFLC